MIDIVIKVFEVNEAIATIEAKELFFPVFVTLEMQGLKAEARRGDDT